MTWNEEKKQYDILEEVHENEFISYPIDEKIKNVDGNGALNEF